MSRIDMRGRKVENKQIDAIRLIGDIGRGELEIDVAKRPNGKIRVWVECNLTSDKDILGKVPLRVFHDAEELFSIDNHGIIEVDGKRLRYKPKKQTRNKAITYPDVDVFEIECQECGHMHDVGDRTVRCNICDASLYRGLERPIKGKM